MEERSTRVVRRKKGRRRKHLRSPYSSLIGTSPLQGGVPERRAPLSQWQVHGVEGLEAAVKETEARESDLGVRDVEAKSGVRETREKETRDVHVELDKELLQELQKKRKHEEEERMKQKERELEAQAEAQAERAKNTSQPSTPSAFSRSLRSLSVVGLGKERDLFVQNLAMMLSAGLPLLDALRTLQLEVRSRTIKRIIQRIADAVENGQPLWRSMEEQCLFSPYALALVRIGEESGNLSQNMGYLSVQQEKDQGLRQKVRMAMMYPTIVLILMFVVVMGLGLFVLPNLIQVLFALNVPLPLVTRLMINFTNFMTTRGTIVVPGVLLGFLTLLVLAKFTALKWITQWVVFRIPGIGQLAREATIARFGVIFGGLLKAGVPLLDALRSLAEVTTILSYRHFYFHLLDRVSSGDSFRKSFEVLPESHKVLPLSVQQLIITGERSGALAEIMLKIADIYEKKAADTAQKLPVILEPILLLIIGSLVAAIALAVILPIYGVVGNVGR